MLPVYFVIGLINIFAKHNNYGIKIEDPKFDVRVRRSIQNTALEGETLKIHKLPENSIHKDISREHINAIYNLIRYNYADLKYNNKHNQNQNYNTHNIRKPRNTWNNNNKTKINENKYTIFNSTWNYLFSLKRSNSNNGNTSLNRNNGFSGYNTNHTIIRSYPYGYPTGYGPRTNISGYKTILPGYSATVTTTPGYYNANNNANNAPYYYNYQYPNGQNFGGYYGYNSSRPGYYNTTPRYNNFNNVPVPYTPGYTPKPFNNTGYNNSFQSRSTILAPYPPGYAPKPANNTFIPQNNISLPYASNYIPTPDMKAEYIPYSNTNPGYNNILAAYAIKPVNNTGLNNNLAPYSNNGNSSYITTPGYNNFNNTTGLYPNFTENPGNNSNTTTIGYNSTLTTTEKIVSSCVICNIPCPQFMKRFGNFCIREDADEEY